MALSVVMPALEMAQETGKVVSWLKREGDAVAKGELLLEIETDKAVVEVEALGEGILGGVTAREGDVVPVGQTIAWLLAPGETPPAPTAPVQTGRRTDASPAVAAPPMARTESTSGSVRISPKARRLARERGIDPATLRGTGPGGEVLADDVPLAGEDVSARGDVDQGRVEPAAATPVSTIGRLMADRTTQSWTTAPHFFVAREVEASALGAARERLVASAGQSHGVKPTHTDLLVAAVARALRKHPRMNASWADGGIRTNADVNVAIAIAVDEGVVTAVVPNADTSSVADIAVRRRDVTERARANRLHPSDLAGATFTISNLGMFGVDAFTAIIVSPQTGILAVGAIADRVVAVDGQIAIRPMMTITLSADHRVVDGARAAAFLTDVVEAIEGEATWQ